MVYVLIIILVVAVAWVVSGPLRHAAGAAGRAAAGAEPGSDSMRRLDLESARDAKYRELRDAELDHQTGKLSDEDYEAIDSTLRSEAIALLHELDEVGADGQPGPERAQ